MADTIRGNFPDSICTDCGKKGCLFFHCGPLVPPDSSGMKGFCGPCWDTRQEYYLKNGKPMPIPDLSS